MTLQGLFKVGQAVEVHAMGRWYRGEVIKVSALRVTVRYTSGTGTTRNKAVNADKVRTLDGQHADKPQVSDAHVAGVVKSRARRLYNNRVAWLATEVIRQSQVPDYSQLHHSMNNPEWIARHEASILEHVALIVKNVATLAREAGLTS